MYVFCCKFLLICVGGVSGYVVFFVSDKIFWVNFIWGILDEISDCLIILFFFLSYIFDGVI